MRLSIYTLGCKLNQCESEALASAFRDQGFSILSPQEEADIYIVNTCTVTSKAEQKARRMIRQFSRKWPDSVVLITGCYAQLDPEDLMQMGPRVRLIPQDNKDILLKLPEYLVENSVKGLSLHGDSLLAQVDGFLSNSEEGEGQADPFAFKVDTFQFHSRAYLKFQDGCNNQCAYCRTTLARGSSVSLPWPEMEKRILELVDHGYREIVLTGVNITSYKTEELGFTGLLGKVEALLRGRGTRIRLSSLEPEAITDELGEILASDVFCPHFHIPVQSGSDSVLKRMRRKNNSEKIHHAVTLLRKAKDDPFIAADVIAGFPGETEEEFEATYELLKNLDFSELHVFPFSPRPGTEAAGLKHPVPERITGERTARLRKLSKDQHGKYVERQLGDNFNFLLEQPKKDTEDQWWATSENYLKALVSIKGIRRGETVPGTLKKSSQGDLVGEVYSLT